VTAAPVAAGEPSISAVGVVVPARDEEERIGRCLHSVRRALAALPADIAVAVAVVLDDCSDTTPRRVAALIADWPDAQVVPATARSSMRPAGSGVGALCDLGLRHVLARLAAHLPAGTWLLSTDADITVPADWARAHLGCAAAGAHAVAGLADLTTAEPLAADALLRYRAIVDDGVRGATHHHVYGANLGVRADAYLDVGGFPRDGAGEDHGLWRRLRAAGYALAQPVGLRVQTSARLDGRAEGGLAHLLRSLHDSSLHDTTAPCTTPPPRAAARCRRTSRGTPTSRVAVLDLRRLTPHGRAHVLGIGVDTVSVVSASHRACDRRPRPGRRAGADVLRRPPAPGARSIPAHRAGVPDRSHRPPGRP
jgi:hypothetical protein